MMIFWRTSTQTLPFKNPKNPEINPKTWYVNEIFLNKFDTLYIVENVLKTLFNGNIFKNVSNTFFEKNGKMKKVNM